MVEEYSAQIANSVKPDQTTPSNRGCERWLCPINTNIWGKYDMSRGMRFPTIWHFDLCRLRRACAASF